MSGSQVLSGNIRLSPLDTGLELPEADIEFNVVSKPQFYAAMVGN